MAQPVGGTYPEYFKNYISHVKADSVAEASAKYGHFTIDFFKSIPTDKAGFRYAEGKWSLKEMLQHIIDAERIFAYRALTIARKDKTPLPGFDENIYAVNCRADNREWQSLLDEFENCRKSTDALIGSFDEEHLQESGTTSGQPNTVIAICFVIYGHILHHINVVKEKYL